MMFKNDYNDENNQSIYTSTGSFEIPKYKIIIYPFDKYEITIKLSEDNKFIEILEVKVNKDFISYKQKITPKGFHDVEKYYNE